jgi:two-component system chemotaxis response regulator CheY
MRALVVDDSRAVRTIVGNMLRELGYDVVAAGNGREALLLLNDEAPVDVAFVDWNMPEMNGLELVTALRQSPEFRELPVVMATSETEISQIAVALEAGANEYAMKPFDQSVVLDKLRLVGLEA